MLIFLDTETTGLEKEDKVCSIAIIYIDSDGATQSKYELIDEGKKIPAKASSINHITNEMLQGKKSLLESEIYTFLELNNEESTIIVGHNVHFDMQKLADVGFKFKGLLLDTLRVSKHLIPECDGYSLQFLRYELKLYKQETQEIVAHNALGDSFVVKHLYEYLLDLASQEEMCELSFKNVLLEKFSFGKYSGKYIEEIVMNDSGYIQWLLSIVDLDDDLRYSIAHYLEGSV